MHTYVQTFMVSKKGKQALKMHGKTKGAEETGESMLNIEFIQKNGCYEQKAYDNK